MRTPSAGSRFAARFSLDSGNERAEPRSSRHRAPQALIGVFDWHRRPSYGLARCLSRFPLRFGQTLDKLWTTMKLISPSPKYNRTLRRFETYVKSVLGDDWIVQGRLIERWPECQLWHFTVAGIEWAFIPSAPVDLTHSIEVPGPVRGLVSSFAFAVMAQARPAVAVRARYDRRWGVFVPVEHSIECLRGMAGEFQWKLIKEKTRVRRTKRVQGQTP